MQIQSIIAVSAVVYLAYFLGPALSDREDDDFGPGGAYDYGEYPEVARAATDEYGDDGTNFDDFAPRDNPADKDFSRDYQSGNKEYDGGDGRNADGTVEQGDGEPTGYDDALPYYGDEVVENYDNYLKLLGIN